jgi:hypothetical protein
VPQPKVTAGARPLHPRIVKLLFDEFTELLQPSCFCIGPLREGSKENFLKSDPVVGFFMYGQKQTKR